jgi:hypothetical protein
MSPATEPRLCECRSCGDPIRFVQLPSGKAMPVNPLQNPAGNVAAIFRGGKLHGHVISKEHPAPLDWRRYTAHYATCEAKPAKPEKAPTPALEPDPALF